MVIDHPDSIVFTSVQKAEWAKGWARGVHFRYEGKDYLVHTDFRDSMTTTLYEGRVRGHVKAVSACYGWVRDLIRYEGNNRTLSHIDKAHFASELERNGLIDRASRKKKN